METTPLQPRQPAQAPSPPPAPSKRPVNRRLFWSDSESDSEDTDYNPVKRRKQSDNNTTYVVDCNCYKGCPCDHCQGNPVRDNEVLWCECKPAAVIRGEERLVQAAEHMTTLKIELQQAKDQLEEQKRYTIEMTHKYHNVEEKASQLQCIINQLLTQIDDQCNCVRGLVNATMNKQED